MTRDEAERIISENIGSHSGKPFPGRWVDTLVALGVLKLDEPKSGHARALDALFTEADGGMLTPRQAIDAITAAGLKIVEK